MSDQPATETVAPGSPKVVESPVEFSVNDEGHYLVPDTEPMSRRQFIQFLFTEHDLSRSDIAAILDLRPNQIYQATVNMENTHHGAGRGGLSAGSGKAEKARELARAGRSRPEIAKELSMSYGAVYAATKSLEIPSARATSANVEVEVDGETRSMSRPDAIRELAKQGRTRPQIREQLGVSYAVVWAATKNMEVVEARSNKVMVEMDDGRSVPRVDAIREYADKGLSRREIADKLDLDYSVVWATTRDHEAYKKEKTAEDEAAEAAAEGEPALLEGLDEDEGGDVDEEETGDEEKIPESLEEFSKADLVSAINVLELDEINTSAKKDTLIEELEALGIGPAEVLEALEAAEG